MAYVHKGHADPVTLQIFVLAKDHAAYGGNMVVAGLVADGQVQIGAGCQRFGRMEGEAALGQVHALRHGGKHAAQAVFYGLGNDVQLEIDGLDEAAHARVLAHQGIDLAALHIVYLCQLLGQGEMLGQFEAGVIGISFYLARTDALIDDSEGGVDAFFMAAVGMAGRYTFLFAHTIFLFLLLSCVVAAMSLPGAGRSCRACVALGHLCLMRRMFKPLPLFIGLRYTRAKRRNHFISFISLTSILGLALGVAVLITVLSVMNGFDRELKNRILGMVPHATLNAYEPFRNWKKVVDYSLREKGVVAAAPFNQLQGMLTTGSQVSGALITGIEPAMEKKVSIIQNHMGDGSIDALRDGEFGIVLGSGLAANLGVMVGDKVTLVLPEASLSPAGVIPRFKRFTVVGVFKVGADIDGLLAYVNINDAARLLRMEGKVQGVRLKLDDLFDAPAVSHALVQKHPEFFYASNWTLTHGNLFSAIKMEKAMMALLLLFIVAVAAFNIVSSLVMVVTDKKADIAILRTLGASPNTIMKIFMVQGTVVGVVGTVSGVLLGVLLSLTISDIATGIEQLFNISLFDAYFVNYLPSQLELDDVVWVSIVAFALSFMATVYPARRAARVQPAEALRYE